MGDDDKVTSFGPVRDRRSGKRYFTVRNVSIFIGAIVGCFILISIASEMRRSPTGGSYGRLYHKRTAEIEVQPRSKMEVISESAPAVNDQKAADPMLLDSVSREAWLGVTPDMLPGGAQPAPASTTGSSSTGITGVRPLDIPKNGKVVITGGAEGVQLKVEQ